MSIVELSIDEIASQFSGNGTSDADIKKQLEGATIHISAYDTPAYEGYAIVIWEKEGKLFIVEGSHCSCYGLEGQWSPTETNWKALANMEFCWYENSRAFKEYCKLKVS